jgi:hypothetical protein
MKDDNPFVAFRALWELFYNLVTLIASVLGLLFSWLGGKANAIQREKEEKIERSKLGARYDTAELAATARRLYASNPFPTTDEFMDAFISRAAKMFRQTRKKVPVESIFSEFHDAVYELYESEELADIRPLSSVAAGEIEAARYRDYLLTKIEVAKEPQKIVDILSKAFIESFNRLADHLPPYALIDRFDQSKSFTVPLIDAMKNVGQAVFDLVLPFYERDAKDAGLFEGLRESLDSSQQRTKKLPNEYIGSAAEIVETYLGDTPLAPIFRAGVPFDIPVSRLLEHAVIVAGSGHGKTQTLGALIARHLVQPDPPAMVVIDSTGALVKRIQTLSLFNDRLRDRIVIIDPEHDPVPALNMFDVSNPRFQTYSQSLRDEVETEIVALFNYIFTSAQNDLTSRQGTVFSYVVRLVLSMPGSTIDTLRQVLEDDPKGGYAASKYRDQIDRLDPTAQAFFKNQYFELKGFREQIAQRVYGLIQVPAFQRMFSSSNKVDFFDELQNRGSIILVNTSERVLKESASPLFGRYVIARTLAAAFERATLPEQDRRPTFLIIDEAAPYFDDTFDRMLTRVRQFKLGVCLAFQHLEQASEKLRSSIASNTSVKLAGGLGYVDSRWLSRDMETTPEFLKAQRRDSDDPPQWTQLGCYVRNLTPSAVSLTVPFFALENLPHMSTEDHQALLMRNRERVSAFPSPKPPDRRSATPATPPSEIPTSPTPPSGIDEDAASQWS